MYTVQVLKISESGIQKRNIHAGRIWVMFRLGDVYYILQVKKYTQFGYMYNVYPAKFRENLPLTNQLKLPPLLCLSRLYMKSFLPLPPCCVCVCVYLPCHSAARGAGVHFPSDVSRFFASGRAHKHTYSLRLCAHTRARTQN